jgi:16S rRNA (guanine966-N2)-methyltransferase
MQKKTPNDRKPAPQRRPTKAPQQVRIIGGQWKRTPLPVADAEGLRPTPDRVRETVFNWLTYFFDGHWQGVACLDLFCGSGALGFEAASRGAARVVLVESHAGAVRHLEAARAKLDATGVTVLRGDALLLAQGLAVRGGAAQFDVIFLDPPYHQQWLPKLLPICRQLLKPGGLVYVEAERSLVENTGKIAADMREPESKPEVVSKTTAGATIADMSLPTARAQPDVSDWLDGWNVVRADRAGMVFYHLLQCGNSHRIEA